MSTDDLDIEVLVVRGLLQRRLTTLTASLSQILSFLYSRYLNYVPVAKLAASQKTTSPE
ncbi:hypothetical protein J6590_041103 [Homalodisca vitripennis]|nr:hypothetical protein J6590_041103 [Homalodisca vitripennis]